MSFRHLCASLLFALVACTDSSTTTSDPTPDASAEPEPPDAPPVEPACSKCGGITDPDTFDPANLCEESQPLFDAVIGCVCGIPDQQPGRCLTECAATVCNPDGAQPDDACTNCIAVQCGPETGACLNDV